MPSVAAGRGVQEHLRSLSTRRMMVSETHNPASND